MSKLLGAVDDRGRPVIRIELAESDASFLALVDTGVKRELMLAEHDARALGFAVASEFRSVRLAMDVDRAAKAGSASINWFGSQRQIDVLVSMDAPTVRRADEPVALVGTGLLAPNLLKIDFDLKTVEIDEHGG